MLVAFSHDVYLHGLLVIVALAVSAAQTLYMKMEIQIGQGSKKSEPALPIGISADSLALPRGPYGEIFPHLVQDVKAYLGISRHIKL